MTVEHVLAAIEAADGGGSVLQEGCVGAGTGTVAFGWKGGIGTSSRRLPGELGGYTVGVLVQSNFGGVLQIMGIPVGERLGRYYLKDQIERGTISEPINSQSAIANPQSPDGSIMIVLATDAPLSDRNLTRLARRAMAGLARTGAAMSNGSGDYAIAFSTSELVRRTPERRSKLAQPDRVAERRALAALPGCHRGDRRGDLQLAAQSRNHDRLSRPHGRSAAAHRLAGS